MINTLKPSAPGGSSDDVKGQVLRKIEAEYGRPADKEREAVKKLGKDEFFKIMISQIQHQDPLKPYQNEEMAAQMAQFTALEQMTNVNSNLEKLATAQAPLHQLGAASLIGKYVTTDSSRVYHTEGKFSDLKFDLPVASAETQVSIVNEKGEVIREITAGALKPGENSVSWDGKKSNGQAAPNGSYMVRISAKTEKNQSIPVTTQKTDIVRGVAFEGKETILLIGNPNSPTKLPLTSVSRIFDRPGAAPAANGLPPGLSLGGAQIGGLENVIPSTGAPSPDGAPAQPEEGGFPAALAEDRAVPGYKPEPAKFQQVDPRYLHESKPDVMPTEALNSQKLAEMMEAAHDLTSANPANSSRGKSQPTGEEQSVAGKLLEGR